jgi:hypothetical protein
VRDRRKDKAEAIAQADCVRADALAQTEIQPRTTFELETLRAVVAKLDATNVVNAVAQFPGTCPGRTR